MNAAKNSAARVAVVGAGIAGLMAARTLMDQGCAVTVLEKSRGPGGRTSTRRTDGGLQFDHGAPYFTATDSGFMQAVHGWLQAGCVAPWVGQCVRIHQGAVSSLVEMPGRYVGVPGMSALARHLALPLTIHLGTRVVSLSRNGVGPWFLSAEGGKVEGPFDHVLLALPASQAAELLQNHALGSAVRSVAMTPCWAVMVAFERAVGVPWDAGEVEAAVLARAFRNSAKPQRSALPETWVLHASAAWSAANLDLSPAQVVSAVLADFAACAAVPLPPAVQADAHRWRFSGTPNAAGALCLSDSESMVALCGDWLADGTVQGAYLSGFAAAARLLRSMGVRAG